LVHKLIYCLQKDVIKHGCFEGRLFGLFVADNSVFNQVADFELNNLIKSKSWVELDNYFQEYPLRPNDSRIKHWIRSKYMIKDYEGCLKLCQIDESDLDDSIIKHKCTFALRSSMKINRDELIEKALLDYSQRFPSELEHKITNMRFSYRKKDYISCLSLSEQILQQDKTNITALLFNARSNKKLKNPRNIEKKSWERIIQYDSKNLEALNNLSKIYFEEGNEKEALNFLEIIFSINPNYEPAFSTSIKMNYDISSKSKNYSLAQMYQQNKYEELINSIGGLNNSKHWSEKEFKLALRSYNNLKRHSEVIQLCESINLENNSDAVILEQLLMANFYLENTKKYSIILKIFSKKSLTDTSFMRLYLRHLIYFSNDDDDTFSEINNLLSIHDNDYLSDVLKYILKSQKYHLIELLFPENSLSEIFDPISGVLKSVIDKHDLNELWQSLDKKIIKSYELDSKEVLKKEYIIPFLSISSDIEKEKLIQKIKSNADDMDNKENLLQIKDELLKGDNSNDSYYQNMNFTNSILCLTLEKKEGEGGLDKDFFYAHLDYEKYKLKGILEKNDRKISSIDILESDPRNILGRYMELVKKLEHTDIIIISWICSIIYDISPKEIITNDGLIHGEIAKLIMGYPK
tara:strand:- start:114 stop:2015 length:1902 start_codon:yes stop_codon:yes gene_type:complete